MQGEADLVVRILAGRDVLGSLDVFGAERPAVELEVEPEPALDERVGPEVPVRLHLQYEITPDLDGDRALQEMDRRRVGHVGAGIERPRDLDRKSVRVGKEGRSRGSACR